jgi:hypothetical protein
MKIDKHRRRTPDQPNRDLPALRFWNGIDRDHFECALTDHDKYDTLLRALHDPIYARCSFPHLLRKFGISLHEAQCLYTDHMRQWALLGVANHLPEIMEDVAEDARSHMEVCPRCDGEKVVESTRGDGKATKPCPNCSGSGQVRVIGDPHARDLVFEAMKLTRQRGPLVAIQNNNFRGNPDSRMEGLLKAAQQAGAIEVPKREPDAIEGRKPAVDADSK